jgi:uncharacterized protein
VAGRAHDGRCDSDIAARIPPRAGLGLKIEHCREILDTRPDLGWFEVHPENYMGAGGVPHHFLEKIRQHFPISLHGVGLSIGGAGRLDEAHLARLKVLIARYEPGLFSEHLAWSTHETVYLPDLLPLPYNDVTLAHIANHVDEVQSCLGRQILIENPSSYLPLSGSGMSEIEFLGALARRTGCGLLLDINNVFVSATNLGFDAQSYIDDFPARLVGEIHLAGHAQTSEEDGSPLLIDAHNSEVTEPVWALYRRAVARIGPVPTLIEWDNDIPEWSCLFAQAQQAEQILAQAPGRS